MGRISEAVTFPGTAGVALAARLDRPTGVRPHAFALFAHCFTCSKDSRAATFVGEALADAGIATLRFDFTGLGGSEGEFANTADIEGQKLAASEGKVDRIERLVTLEGELDTTARAKLLEIANKCPVHRALHGEVTVPTRAG